VILCIFTPFKKCKGQPLAWLPVVQIVTTNGYGKQAHHFPEHDLHTLPPFPSVSPSDALLVDEQAVPWSIMVQRPRSYAHASAMAFSKSSSAEDLHPNHPTSGWLQRAITAPFPVCLHKATLAALRHFTEHSNITPGETENLPLVTCSLLEAILFY